MVAAAASPSLALEASADHSMAAAAHRRAERDRLSMVAEAAGHTLLLARGKHQDRLEAVARDNHLEAAKDNHLVVVADIHQEAAELGTPGTAHSSVVAFNSVLQVKDTALAPSAVLLTAHPTSVQADCQTRACRTY